MCKSDSKRRYFVFILLLFLLMSISLLNSDLPFLNNDSPFYLMLARSISLGEGYRDLYYPGNPFHVECPFFYPLLLALILKIFPGNIIALKLVSILFGLASLVAIYILFSDKYRRLQSAKFGSWSASGGLGFGSLNWLLLLTSTNLWFLSFSTGIVPEIPYLFLSLVALILLNKYEQCSKIFDKYLFITVFTLAITFFTRSIGLALVMATGIYFLIIKGEHKKGFCLVGLWSFSVLPWIIWMTLTSPYAVSKNYIGQFIYGHKESFISIFRAIIWNITHYWQVISSLLLPDFFLPKLTEEVSYFPFLYGLINKRVEYFSIKSLPVLSFFLSFIIFTVTIIGFIYQFKKKRLTEIYILCYLSIVFVFPPWFFVESGNRFFIPLLPFVLYYFFIGLFLLVNLFKYQMPDTRCQTPDARHKGLQKRGSRYRKFPIEFVTCFVLLTANLMPIFWLIKSNLRYLANYKYLSLEERKDYYPTWFMDRFMPARWIRKNTSPGAIFMYIFPPPFYLATERKTVYFTETPCPERKRDLAEIASIIKEKEVNYIVTVTIKEEEIVGQLNQRMEDMVFFPLVQFESTDEMIKIYKVSGINPEAKTANQEGVNWYLKTDFNKAKKHFKQAIGISPHPLEYFNLGQCDEKEGKIDEALFAYEKAVKLEPNYELIKDRINIIRQEEKLKDNLNNPLEYMKLGRLYLKNYKFINSAISLFKKALSLDPTVALIHYELGRAYIIDEAYDVALTELRTALKLLSPLSPLGRGRKGEGSPGYSNMRELVDSNLKYKIKHYIRVAKQKKKEKELSYLGRGKTD